MHFKLRDIFVLTFAVALLFALVIPAIMSAPDTAQRAGERLESPYGVWGALGTIASGEEIPAVE